jgi:2,3-bisphosphoglycerate-independent phosphoglycerate mutase
MVKLIKIVKSKKAAKKYDAHFKLDNGKEKVVSFGQSGASDFTIHGDPERKERYLRRHRSRENWNNFLTAGSLSRFLLWNRKTLKASIADYKRRFKL